MLPLQGALLASASGGLTDPLVDPLANGGGLLRLGTGSDHRSAFDWDDTDHASSDVVYTRGRFDEGASGEFHADFADVLAKMAPVVRRALVDDVVDDDDAALVEQLGCHLLPRTRALLRRRGAISPAGCEALRRAVDAERDVTRDSVDRIAQHQRNISFDTLLELVGREDVERLWALPDELLALQREEAAARALESGTPVSEKTRAETEAADGGFYVDLFVRRYTRESRPWIAFHMDVNNVTVNVALSDDRTHEGGRLHAILNGRHEAITREEGEATAHGDDIMHGVSAMRGGVRHSLIMFFYTLQDTEESREWQTNPLPKSGARKLTDVPCDAGVPCAVPACELGVR